MAARRRSSRGIWAAAAIGAGLALAGHGGHGHGLTAILDSLNATPPSTGTTAGQQAWARALLKASGFRRTSCNVSAVAAWEATENSNPGWNNPLDTTYDANGAWETSGKITATENSAGVRAYSTPGTGLRATVITLNFSLYGGIRAALAQHNDAQAVADAVAASPWGTQPFTATC